MPCIGVKLRYMAFFYTVEYSKIVNRRIDVAGE